MSARTDTVIDSRDFGVIDGFRIVAEIGPDLSVSDPREWDDSIGEEEARAWRAGEWSFVTLIVRATHPDSGQEGSAAMGRFAHGFLPGAGWVSPLEDDGRTFANGYGADLVAEAAAAARRS